MADKSRNKRRPSIYLSPPLERVVDNLGERHTLSQRLATIAERYELTCSQPPELTETERQLISTTLSGSLVEPLLIKHLDSELEDSDAGDPSEIRDLAARVRTMSYADRVAMIESLGF